MANCFTLYDAQNLRCAMIFWTMGCLDIIVIIIIIIMIKKIMGCLDIIVIQPIKP
jgi:hypothetical protein